MEGDGTQGYPQTVTQIWGRETKEFVKGTYIPGLSGAKCRYLSCHMEGAKELYRTGRNG